MSRSSHHVVPNPDGGWDVKRGGAARASGHYSTKKEAVMQDAKSARTKKLNL